MSGWQVKLCDPFVTHMPYLSALEVRHDEALYKSTLTYYFTPDPQCRGWGWDSPPHDATTPMASRLCASIFGASAKVPLFVECKKSLNYTVQHCGQPFGPYVQTDINVTGLVVKGPRVSICPSDVTAFDLDPNFG